MVFPTDIYPLEVMLPHQLRMIAGEGAVEEGRLEVVIVDNRPEEGSQSPQDEFLKKVRSAPGYSIKSVDYSSVLEDHELFGRFFAFDDASPDQKLTISGLVNNESDRHEKSNFAGMLTALSACLDADPSVETCIYLDPDILVSHGSRGRPLLDLVPAAFAANPTTIVMEPPMLCQFADDGTSQDGTCLQEAPRESGLSQRHLIFNRKRLADAVPLHAKLDFATGLFKGAFENLITNTVWHDLQAASSMLCGMDTVMSHPAVEAYSFQHSDGADNETGLVNQTDILNGSEHRAVLASSPTGRARPLIAGFSEVASKGSQELVSRFEEGNFQCTNELLELFNIGQCTWHCLTIRPSRARVEAGLPL